MRHTVMVSRSIICTCIVGIALATVACGSTITVSTAGPGGGTSSPDSPTTTVPATTGPAATCDTLLPGGFATSSPSLPAFADAPLPGASFATAVTTHLAGNNILWSIYLEQACTNTTTVSGVQSFFASHYPSSGWAQAPKMPFDGGYFAPCGDPYCWGKDTVQRFVGLENVAAHGTSVTYQLRLFVPPAPPSCSFSGYPTNAFQPFVGTFTGLYVALPPNSITVPDDASGGQKGYDICSTGTQSSIVTFMDTELPKQGFSIVSGAATTHQTWQNGGHVVNFSVDSPTSWEIDWRVPLPTG
jgi:hypothetical protein